MKDEVAALKVELIKIMCSDADSYYRKLALVNIELTEDNYSDIVERTRDTDPELRMTVYRKLIKEKIFLANL